MGFVIYALIGIAGFGMWLSLAILKGKFIAVGLGTHPNALRPADPRFFEGGCGANRLWDRLVIGRTMTLAKDEETGRGDPKAAATRDKTMTGAGANRDRPNRGPEAFVRWTVRLPGDSSVMPGLVSKTRVRL